MRDFCKQAKAIAAALTDCYSKRSLSDQLVFPRAKQSIKVEADP